MLGKHCDRGRSLKAAPVASPADPLQSLSVPAGFRQRLLLFAGLGAAALGLAPDAEGDSQAMRTLSSRGSASGAEGVYTPAEQFDSIGHSQSRATELPGGGSSLLSTPLVDSLLLEIQSHGWSFEAPFWFGDTPPWVPHFGVDIRIVSWMNPGMPMTASAFAILDTTGGNGLNEDQIGWLEYDMNTRYWPIDPQNTAREEYCRLLHEMAPMVPDTSCNYDTVDIDPDPATRASALQFESAYPNPFNPVTNIRFFLNETARDLRVSVVNMLGQTTDVLPVGALGRGQHEMSLDLTHRPGGIYIITAEADFPGGSQRASQRVIKLP